MIVIDGKGLNEEKADAIEGSGLKPLKLIMNNGAVLYQEIGALQPFTWTASISGHVHGGNK